MSEHSQGYPEAPRRTSQDSILSDRTKIQLTAFQGWSIIASICGGAMMLCAFYFGITARFASEHNEVMLKFAEVNQKLSELQWEMRDSPSRDEMRNWIDALRDENPGFKVPNLASKK